MADEKLSQQTAFSGTLQDTDCFYVIVDTGGGSFASRKIKYDQLKPLLPTLYTEDGDTGSSPRTVTVGDSLLFEAGDQTINLTNSFIQWQRIDTVDSDNTRSVSINSSFLNVDSRTVRYRRYDEHTHTLTTISNAPVTLNVYTPSDSSHFMVKAWVKAFATAGETAYFKEYTALYKTAAGVTTLIGTPDEYEENTDMTVTAVFDVVGNTVRLRVTGLAMLNVDWTAVVKVM